MNEPVIKINGSEVEILEKANAGLSITYSIVDIINIDERTSARTKSINIPATKNNDKIIGFGTDINSKNFLSQNDSIAASIEIAGIDVINGVAKMVGSTVAADGTETYELTIKGDNSDWKERIKGKSLKDLDFSKYDHVWNKANIDASEATTGTAGTIGDGVIVYPLINYGAPSGGHPIAGNLDVHDVLVQDRFPSIQIFAILKKIFNTVGFKIESNFLNSDFFKRLYLIFTGKFIKSAGKKYLEFRAGDLRTLFSPEDNNSVFLAKDPTFAILPFRNDSADGFFDIGNNFVINSPSTTIGNFGGGKTVSPYFPCDSKYIVSESFKGQFILQLEIKQKAVLFIDLQHCNGQQLSAQSLNGNPLPSTDFFIEIRKNNIVIASINISGSKDIFESKELKTDVMNFFINDIITVGINRFGSSGHATTSEISIKRNAIFYNAIENDYIQGNTIAITDALPDIQQTDFLKSIINMFNLYFVTDAATRTVTIEPRDNFYKSIAEDWTDKLNSKREINIQWIGDKVGKNFSYEYSDDSNDAFVKSINDKQLTKFGTREIENKNRFSTGEKKITVAEFAPTLMSAWGYIGLQQSKVPQLNEDLILFPDTPPKNTEFKPRILYYNGVTDVKSDEQWFFEGIARKTYPYMYSQEDDVDNDNTLHFNNTRRSKGLWERFHRNLFETITDGKLMTTWFDLTESDIAKLDFRVPTYFKDAYYIKNKIDGFQPGAGRATKVELIYSPNLDANILIRGKLTNNSGLTVFGGGGSVDAGGKAAIKDKFEPMIPAKKIDDSKILPDYIFAESALGIFAASASGMRAIGGGNNIEDGVTAFGVGIRNVGSRQVVVGSYPAEIKDSDAFVIGRGTKEEPATAWSVDKRGEIHPSGGNYMKMTRNGNVVDMEMIDKDTGLSVKVIEKHSIEISKFLRLQ